MFLNPWGALSDERTGLSFVCAAGPCQRSLSRVLVPWDLRPYITVSDLRLPFSSPPTTRRVAVELFDPASTQVISYSFYFYPYLYGSLCTLACLCSDICNAFCIHVFPSQMQFIILCYIMSYIISSCCTFHLVLISFLQSHMQHYVLWYLLKVVHFKSLKVHHYLFQEMWSSLGVRIFLARKLLSCTVAARHTTRENTTHRLKHICTSRELIYLIT
jgi:hypothetical protein